MKIYLITDYAELDGVLDLYTNEYEAKKEFYTSEKNSKTLLLEIKYDGRIYDYDRENYKINFFEKKENNKGWATPYLDKTCLDNWGIKTKELLYYNRV